MRKLLAVFALFVSAFGFAQLGGEDDVYSSDIIAPKFQGGDVLNFHQYVVERFDKERIGKPGRMVAVFTITETGEIANLRITEFVDAVSAQEFIRVIKSAPKWEPAQKGGKPYALKITLPVEFKSNTLSFPRPKRRAKSQ